MLYQLAEGTMQRQSIFCLFLIVVAVSGQYVTPVPYLVNGTNTTIERYPFVASIRHSNTHFCGGSIISPLFILTAAHCLVPLTRRENSLENVMVVTGTHNVQVGGEAHRPAAIFPHSEYVRSKGGFDIGLVKLEEPIQFNEVQQPIALPISDVQSGIQVTVVAWGATDFPVVDISQRLQNVTVAVTDVDECQQYYPRGFVMETEFCTLAPRGLGICKGDSGSPAVYDGHVVGIVSKGVPCATGNPDIFTNVYKYLDYIHTIMAQ